jgi:hypothetical protein
MVWTDVKVVGKTLTLPDGSVLSRGPAGWEAPRPIGTAGPYELVELDSAFATYRPVSGGTVRFPFAPRVPNSENLSAIAMNDPL